MKQYIFYTLFAPAIIFQRVAIEVAGAVEYVEYTFFNRQYCPSKEFPYPEPTEDELLVANKFWFSDWFYSKFAFPFQTSRGIRISLPLSVAVWTVVVIEAIRVFKALQ